MGISSFTERLLIDAGFFRGIQKENQQAGEMEKRSIGYCTVEEGE